MSNPLFSIGADGVDCESLVDEIRRSVAEKTEKGVYSDVRVARAERANMANLRDRDDFVEFYMNCLRDAVFVDISDFEITERRNKFSGALILLKRMIWKLLKFYTYRLWSQQNQVNGLLLSAVETTQQKQREEIEKLEARIKQLERQGASE